MTSSDQSKTFSMREMPAKRVSHVWQEALRSTTSSGEPHRGSTPRIIHLHIHSHSGTEMCHHFYVRAFTARSSTPAIDFWLNVHISLRPALWHPLIGLILIWYQITDALKRLRSTSDLSAGFCLCVASTASRSPFFPYIARSLCMLSLCFMWITSQHGSSRTNTQLICNSLFQTHSRGIWGNICWSFFVFF